MWVSGTGTGCRRSFSGLFGLGFVVIASWIDGSVCAAEGSGEDASAWETLSDLLERREYGTAAAFLESYAEDTDAKLTQEIEADRQVVEGLLALHKIVREQGAALRPGTPLKISGIDYVFERYDVKPQGDELVLKSKVSGRELRKPLSALPATTWMELAEPGLSTLENSSLILGVFVGFDRMSDPKTARQLLNQAATDGANVSRWLTRLEEAGATEKRSGVKHAAPGEPKVVSTWAHQVNKDGKVIKRQTFKLYSNGRINHPEAGATWQLKGNLLMLSWPHPEAPGGKWQDVCTLSPDRKLYIGKNQQGFTLRGIKLSDGDVGE